MHQTLIINAGWLFIVAIIVLMTLAPFALEIGRGFKIRVFARILGYSFLFYSSIAALSFALRTIPQ